MYKLVLLGQIKGIVIRKCLFSKMTCLVRQGWEGWATRHQQVHFEIDELMEGSRERVWMGGLVRLGVWLVERLIDRKVGWPIVGRQVDGSWVGRMIGCVLIYFVIRLGLHMNQCFEIRNKEPALLDFALLLVPLLRCDVFLSLEFYTAYNERCLVVTFKSLANFVFCSLSRTPHLGAPCEPWAANRETNCRI